MNRARPMPPLPSRLDTWKLLFAAPETVPYEFVFEKMGVDVVDRERLKEYRKTLKSGPASRYFVSTWLLMGLREREAIQLHKWLNTDAPLIGRIHLIGNRIRTAHRMSRL